MMIWSNHVAVYVDDKDQAWIANYQAFGSLPPPPPPAHKWELQDYKYRGMEQTS